MKQIFLSLSVVLCFLMAKSQSNTFPATGNTGIGVSSPIYKLQAVSSSSFSTVVAASGLDYNFSSDRLYNGVNFLPAIGFPEIGAGLVNYNDGYVQTLGCTINNKLLWNGSASENNKIFRINAAENNLGNFSLELRNNGNYSLPGRDWIGQPNSAVILAWNHSLNIGTHCELPLRLFSDNNDNAHIADIFIQNSQVGVGTETPNANAKLDVNGNIYSNGKVFIGTPDANTITQIAPYALAVNGTAVFTKAKVSLYGSWPDYVFHKDYQLPTLTEIETFIKLNGHLPEVPTAEEIQKNGIDLGDTQVLLLKKVEELTLILIEQNKRIEQLEKEVKTKPKRTINK